MKEFFRRVVRIKDMQPDPVQVQETAGEVFALYAWLEAERFILTGWREILNQLDGLCLEPSPAQFYSRREDYKGVLKSYERLVEQGVVQPRQISLGGKYDLPYFPKRLSLNSATFQIQFPII